MATIRVFHTGIILFANLKSRALLPDARCGHGTHDHSMPGPAAGGGGRQRDVDPHFAYIRFAPYEAFNRTASSVEPQAFKGIDLVDGKFKTCGLVQLYRKAIHIEGKFKDDYLTYERRTPAGEEPADAKERGVYYWVPNPQRFCADPNITISSEYLDDDPKRGIAAYVDIPFGHVEPFFGSTIPRVWAFRPRARGNRDHTQALAQVVLKTLTVANGAVALVFRTFGEKEKTKLVFKAGKDVDIVVGNSTVDNMLLRPKAAPRSPDLHFDIYYDYLCPAQQTRPLPHLKVKRRGTPDLGGDNCPPIDPGP